MLNLGEKLYIPLLLSSAADDRPVFFTFLGLLSQTNLGEKEKGIMKQKGYVAVSKNLSMPAALYKTETRGISFHEDRLDWK